VQRAIINGTNGDEVKITNLTLAGCTVHVVNAGTTSRERASTFWSAATKTTQGKHHGY
jgi:hypothetical protein